MTPAFLDESLPLTRQLNGDPSMASAGALLHSPVKDRSAVRSALPGAFRSRRCAGMGVIP